MKHGFYLTGFHFLSLSECKFVFCWHYFEHLLYCKIHSASSLVPTISLLGSFFKDCTVQMYLLKAAFLSVHPHAHSSGDKKCYFHLKTLIAHEQLCFKYCHLEQEIFGGRIKDTNNNSKAVWDYYHLIGHMIVTSCPQRKGYWHFHY